MSDSNSSALPLPSHENENSSSPGRYQEVKWEVVARMPGITPATIVAGRLKTEGIPVRVWQEGAGQALGLTVGLLGTGYVAVPEEFADRALEILEDEQDPDAFAEAFDDFDDSAFDEEL
ncbi:putative signal transducing protein [Candidatus Leptofilum sp.]|uniref:putative signal transducing protein n=1 Tax=Candidatus Leptofilum sp. TaxID=3241576 RepID=UPI003B5BE7B8